MKWTALIGVSPGTSTRSVNGAGTVTGNVCVADVFEPPVSVAVTVTVDVPGATGVTVTVLLDTDTVATSGDDDVAA